MGKLLVSFNPDANVLAVLGILSAVLAFAAMIVVFITILPAKKRDSLPKGLKIIHDICNFNGLIIEKILKGLYIFFTVFFIIFSFFMMFGDIENFGIYFLLMIISPIAIRLTFELFMMAILLIKNVIAINLKLKNQNDVAENSDAKFDFDYSQFKASAPESNHSEPQNPVTFCTKCGTKSDGNNAFCTKCGNKL